MSVSQYQDFSLYIFYVFILAGFLVILNAIYFQIRYQKKTDQLFHGENYIDGGWLFNSQRMMMYAHFCLFDKRAKRAGVFDQVQKMPPVIRFHLLAHWIMAIFGGLAMVVLGVMDYVYLN